DPSAYARLTPSVAVSLRLASGTQTGRAGDACPLSATRYAKRDDSPKIFLTTLAGRDLLMKSIQEFRRKRVLPFDRLQVTQLKIAGPQETVVLYREGQGEKAVWKIKAPVETAADQPEVKSLLFALEDLKEPDQVKTRVIKTGGQEYALSREGGAWLVDGDPNAKADAARVNMLVTRVVRLQAERIATENPADLKRYGLATPAAELIAAGEQGKLLGRITFGRQEQGLAYAMGSAMAGVFQVRPDILQNIPKKEDLLAGAK